MNRAYSTINIKSVDEERRIIEGIASTPTPDRVGDVVVPEGMEFKTPFPFLYQHNSRQPIGLVTSAMVSSDGMRVRVQIAKGGVAPFIDEAWALIKEGLIRGLSIGFRSLEESWDKTLNGYRYLRTEIMELSAVTIPANAEASITSIKSASHDALAASGQRRAPVQLDIHSKTPGASGNPQRKTMKSISEQLAALEAKRQASVGRKEAILTKGSDEGRTMDDVEKQEFDGLDAEIESIDEQITRLKKHQKQIDSSVPITEKAGASTEGASKARGGIVTVKGPNLPKGTAFTRYAIALLRAKGNLMQAAEISKAWRDSTPEVEQVLKVAVAAGTTTTDGWASELADYVYMASEFIEYLRPQTIIGRIPNLRPVPFNVRLPLQDSGSTVNWVGQAGQKPVGKLHFDTTTLGIAKAAGIVVVTEELIRLARPSAEGLVRDDMARAIAQFLDEQFVDPSVVAVSNVSPASITYGAATSVASGTTATDLRNDLQLALSQIIQANIDPTGLVIVMQPVLAVALQLLRNDLGVAEFPNINASGGSLEGYAVVTSMSVPVGTVIFLVPREIMLADEGGISLDASREASIVMDDGVSPASTTMVSLWQKNLVGLRVERMINWARRRTAAVYYLTAAGYGGASPS
ncbi:phage major capsid protein [bacterium]|nr:MAG: phage major capsid protein [bacterium]